MDDCFLSTEDILYEFAPRACNFRQGASPEPVAAGQMGLNGDNQPRSTPP